MVGVLLFPPSINAALSSNTGVNSSKHKQCTATNISVSPIHTDYNENSQRALNKHPAITQASIEDIPALLTKTDSNGNFSNSHAVSMLIPETSSEKQSDFSDFSKQNPPVNEYVNLQELPLFKDTNAQTLQESTTFIGINTSPDKEHADKWSVCILRCTRLVKAILRFVLYLLLCISCVVMSAGFLSLIALFFIKIPKKNK